jgi:hypothetical protein
MHSPLSWNGTSSGADDRTRGSFLSGYKPPLLIRFSNFVFLFGVEDSLFE